MSSTQFDSPSYLFAKRVVDTLRPQVQRQPRPESFAERCSTRIKSQLFKACKIILERTENISTRGKLHIATTYGVESIWKGITPDQSFADKLLPNHRRLKTPANIRKKMLEDLVKDLPEQTSQARKALISTYSSSAASLIKWAVIEGCMRSAINEREETQTALAHLQQLASLSEDALLAWILKALETLPAYDSAHSLRHRYRGRIGLRQLALRPDLETFGYARDGGVLI
ncbi:hypothetical protein JCM5350_002943 [Sporobolomyces pararoseus]